LIFRHGLDRDGRDISRSSWRGLGVIIASLPQNGYISARLDDEREDYTKMKAGIHPEYKRSVVTCICGNTFVTRSTAGDLKLEICSNCHPFFTGRQKLVDSAGRVERYNKKYSKKAASTS